MVHIKVFLNTLSSFPITITFIFDIFFYLKITYSYWFVTIFFLLKKGLNIFNYFICHCFNLLFGLKRFLIFSIFFFFFFRLFLYFYFTWFLLITMNIFDTFWFTIILLCTGFKKTYNFVFNATLCFFYGLGNMVTVPIVPSVYKNVLFFLISFIDTLISFKSFCLP